MDWQSIKTAPRDGTAILATIPGHGKDNIIAWCGGMLDAKGDECGSWVFVEDQEPPPCWTDGVCWDFNENLEASIKPTAWKRLST